MFAFQFGIEEEYFVVDMRTRNVRAVMPKEFFRLSKADLKGHVTNELLQSQIEVMTSPCETMAEARQQIVRFRRVLADHAARHGLGIVAVGTHPFAIWSEQKHTPKDRYTEMMIDLQMLGLRNMLCGMHVHVDVPDPSQRVALMYRTIPVLPLLLALSTSSPFWQGHRTGLLGYRLAAYGELPRTGLPELFKTSMEYQTYVDTLVAAGIIKDASYIWWAVRPSLSLPTLELRIADACTHLEDALCIAAIYRCLVRHLVNHPNLNADLDVVDRAFAEENKWRAQRYGTAASFIDRSAATATPIETAVGSLLELLAEDAQALDCVKEFWHAVEILKRGSSADEQLRMYAIARSEGHSHITALKSVVDWLYHTTIEFDTEPISAGPRSVESWERRIY